MAGDHGSQAIVRTIIDLARNLGLETVAEGVETPDLLCRLGELGCRYAQGFGIAGPMSAAELVDWQPGQPGAASPHRPDGSLTP
jgi:predicted signal transduction protein with EAL and GGDEF domain